MDLDSKFELVLILCASLANNALATVVPPISQLDVQKAMLRTEKQLAALKKKAVIKIASTILATGSAATLAWNWANSEKILPAITSQSLPQNKGYLKNRLQECLWIFFTIPLYSFFNNLSGQMNPGNLKNLWPTWEKLLRQNLSSFLIKAAILQEFAQLDDSDNPKYQHELMYFINSTKISLIYLIATLNMALSQSNSQKELLRFILHLTDKTKDSFNELAIKMGQKDLNFKLYLNPFFENYLKLKCFQSGRI